MSLPYIFSYKVQRQHPYIEPPVDTPRDTHKDCYMALVRCMASNPPRLLNLKDDESILFNDLTKDPNTYEITLAGEEPVVKLSEIVRTPEGRAYVMKMMENYQ